MAEFVEARTEEWINELTEMERVHMFKPEEVKLITSKRRDFEYRVQKRSKCKEDLIKYIEFEENFYKLVKDRRQKLEGPDKTFDWEYAQASRVARLYKQALYRFQDDVDMWFSYFKFCETVQFQTSIGRMLGRFVQVHSHRPDLWLYAANWELTRNKSIDNARQFLLRAVRFHPESKELYLELFRVELEYWKQRRKEKETRMAKGDWPGTTKADEEVMTGRLAEVIYDSAKKKITDIMMKIAMLQVAQSYGNLPLQNVIFHDMMAMHSEDEMTWDTLAKREFNGIIYEDPEITMKGEPMEIDLEKEAERNSHKSKVIRSIDAYRAALKKINTEKMWGLYLDHLLDLQDNGSVLPLLKKKYMTRGFDEAMESGMMSEKHFLHFIDTMQPPSDKKMGKKLNNVLKCAITTHPQSVELWFARIKFFLTQDLEKLGCAVFTEAMDNLTGAPAQEVLPMWKMLIQYYQTKSSAKVQRTFKEGLARGGEIGQLLKPFYIEWLVLDQGIGTARQEFESEEMQNPPCQELLYKMASLEAIQPDTSMKAIRRCHELSCLHFGKTDPEAWLASIKFEIRYGEPPRVSHIYARAMKELNPQLVADFVSGFSQFNMELSS